jgi:NAD(P)-dependent dehydrogenase (short-subunit alcohol dehydrogenase family)
MNPTYDFTGQVALVTGASSGIGAATAKAFSEAGAALVLVDRDDKKLRAVAEALTVKDAKVITIAGDVSDEALAKSAVDRAVAEFGRLDLAYNNAGILGPMCPMTEETAEGYAGCVDTPMGDAIDPDDMKAFLKEQPIGRAGRPEELAAAVLWLCSPGASFVLGIALPVDGGFVAH